MLDANPPENPAVKRRHKENIRNQRLAFASLRLLSLLTIAALAAILSFILWKGLRFSNFHRSVYIPIEESAPDGFAVVVNNGQRLESLDWLTLYGMFTDEYINWAKIDGADADLVPVVPDPSTPEGGAAGAFLFGPSGPDAPAPWGGLVKTVPSAAAALEVAGSTPGSVALVPAEAAEAAAASGAALRILPLRRVVLAVHPSVMEFVENDRLRDLSPAEADRVLRGRADRWSDWGGPDIPVVSLAPPSGSSLETILTKGGIAFSGNPAPDMASYLDALSTIEGAAGCLFARDAAEAGLPSVMRSGRESGWNLTLRYLLEEPRLSGRIGGISTIVLNTVFMLALTVLFAAPIGIAAAVYLVEYARQGTLLRILRLGTETLAGIPSILFGLFGFIFFVGILGFGFGLLSGSLTLTLMILPTIVRTSEEALKSVSRALREGSLALGATKLQTIVRVVIPAAAPGILTGVILAVGRAVGETAALLFTLGSDYQLAKGLFSSARALAAHVYLLFAEGISFDRAFATATVLVVVVLGFNFAARALLRGMGRAGRA